MDSCERAASLNSLGRRTGRKVQKFPSFRLDLVKNVKLAHSTPLKTNISLTKMMVERCISYCNSPFLGDMLIFGGVNKTNTSRSIKTL